MRKVGKQQFPFVPLCFHAFESSLIYFYEIKSSVHVSKQICSVQSMFEMFRWKKEQSWKEAEENKKEESHRILAL